MDNEQLAKAIFSALRTSSQYCRDDNPGLVYGDDMHDVRIDDRFDLIQVAAKIRAVVADGESEHG